MTSLAQNSNHDIYTVDGLIAVASGKDAQAHIIADAIRTLEGELQLDIEAGIPYQRTVWESRSRVNIWQHFVRERVLAFPFVQEIVSFTVDLGTEHQLHYTLTVRTDNDTITVEQ